MRNSNSVASSDDDMADVCQYLTFRVDGDTLGVKLEEVKEVIEIRTITALPRTPNYVRGVINLRGQIIPVIDLKLKFSMGLTEFTVDSCIVLIEMSINDDVQFVGALADSVREVVDMFPKDISQPPKMGSSVDVKFVAGMGRHEDEFFTVLNTATLFSMDELLAGSVTGPVSSQII